ncbi:YqaA family protein [Chitinilyticum piscinae]|uniref:DedA family protein n=1 Tax=Chitinilyticum piscinae TaxID=2866724 RepID=A0A8J7KBE8_9NEIS|nr:DedA family protein [Chitinilyticum piscinae]MBE9610159.1 DedA family protein [Chitinilyticum piscinae]
MTFWLLAGLFASAFLSATLLPGNSEAVLLALLGQTQRDWLLLVLVATVGNVLGGLLTVWLGRRLPAPQRQGRLYGLAERWGPVSLLLSWVPVAGDALCGLAGWLRWSWGAVCVWLALGKALRYLLLAGLALQLL